MSHQRPFSSNFRRLKPNSTFFRDFSPDTNDMFGFDDPAWTLPRTSSRFGSSFDSPRSNMRPAFRSRHFDDEPFFRNRTWMDDDPRTSRGYSPDSRHSPTSQSGSPTSQSFFRSMDANGGIPIRVKHEGSSRSSTPSNEDNEPDSPVPAPGVEKHPGVTSKVNAGNPQTAKRQPKVHHIPIRVEARDEEMGGQQQEIPVQQKANVKTSPQQPHSPKTFPRKAKSTVHIIPTQVNGDAKESSSKPPSPEAKAATPPPPLKPTEMNVIETTMIDLERLRPRVEKFRGSRKDKEYLYLDEMLTRHLIRLDNLIAEGNSDLRQIRRAAIKKVNECIHVLESNVVDAQKEEEVERKDGNVNCQVVGDGSEKDGDKRLENLLDDAKDGGKVDIESEEKGSEEEKMDTEVKEGEEKKLEGSGEDGKEDKSSEKVEDGKEDIVDMVGNKETETDKCDLQDKSADVDMVDGSTEESEKEKTDSKMDDETEPKVFTTTINLQIT